MTPSTTNKLTAAQQAAIINQQARNAIKQTAVKMQQILVSNNFNNLSQQQITVQPRNVGLLLGFLVEITHSVSNGSAVAINFSDFGPMNCVSQIQFNDFNNTTRIQSPGWHVSLVNSVRHKRPFGTAILHGTGFDAPVNFGANFGAQIGLAFATGGSTSSIPAGGTGNVTMYYWVPIAYSDEDLRGAIYANVVNAQAQLIMGMPGTNGISICAPNGSDSTQSIFVGAAAGSVSAVAITSTSYTVYQYYYDQLPMTKTGPLLPVTDLATVYELKMTQQTAIPQNQDFGYQYANFRNFLSTIVVYVNTGSTGARGNGFDINYWSLQAANTTNIWKKAPYAHSMEFRNFFGTDFPPGCYYFGSRQKPIITTQYGNMQLVMNAATANAGAYQLVGVEDLALIQTLSMAGSLPSN